MKNGDFLLNNLNVYASVPVGYSVRIKEEDDNIRILLEKVKYAYHQWKICGDSKITTVIFGHQGGFTKNPCFLCLWNS